MILAGDVGGTYTRLGLFETASETRCVREGKFPNTKFSGLEKIISEFLGKEKVSRVCLGVAGPVREERCVATNLPWVIDAAVLKQRLGVGAVHLINDLEANAYGIRMLKQEELALLYPGNRGQQGNQGLIAAGTGLGEAGLYWNGKEHLPFASEGGHTDFAPRDPIEVELLVFLQKKFGHVSYERVISGPGFVELYEFLVKTGRGERNSVIQEQMKAGNPGAVISEYGRLGKDETCSKVVDWFLSLYGAEAGNLALKYLALGGVYVGGGIAPHLLDRMKQGLFHQAFIDKGRFKDLLSSIPVWVILNDRAALLGAAYVANYK